MLKKKPLTNISTKEDQQKNTSDFKGVYGMGMSGMSGDDVYRNFHGLGSVITGLAPIRLVVGDLVKGISGDTSSGTTLTTKDFSSEYNAQGAHLTQIMLDELRKLNKLPTKPGLIVRSSIEPRHYKAYNKALGRTEKYADFSLRNLASAALGGGNAFEFTNGGMSSSILLDPSDPNYYLVTNTDASAWDVDNPKLNLGIVRAFMGKYGAGVKNNGEEALTKQRYLYRIPRDFQVIPGTISTQDYNYPIYD